MNCSNCEEEAVIQVKLKNKYYCTNHFKRYFLSHVGKVLDKYTVDGEVSVAISGGKDSSACLEALTHFDRVKVSAFHIDLGIGEYSRRSRNHVKKITDELDIDLDIIDLEREYNFNIPDLIEKRKEKACSLCGMIKRYIMNKYIFENDYDYLATGHNLIDEVSSTFNNLANVYLTPFRGLKPVLENDHEYRLSARIKPLFYLKEKECLVYVETNMINYLHGECPLSIGAPTNQLKEWLQILDSKRPGILRNFARSFMRIEEKMSNNRDEINKCKNCGYATATRICKFCRVVKDFLS